MSLQVVVPQTQLHETVLAEMILTLGHFLWLACILISCLTLVDIAIFNSVSNIMEKMIMIFEFTKWTLPVNHRDGPKSVGNWGYVYDPFGHS